MKPTTTKNHRWGITTLLIAVGILLLGTTATILAHHFDLQTDMTNNHFCKLSVESIDFITEINQDITITVCNSEEAFLAHSTPEIPQPYILQVKELLEEYKAYSPHISVEYLPYYNNSGFSQQEDILLSPNDIIIQSGEHWVQIPFLDLFEFTTRQDQQVASASKVENIITTTLSDLISVEKPVVTLLTGYGQPSIPKFQEVLSSRNYTVSQIDITKQAIPKDSSVVILVAPEWDLSPEDISKLEHFLSADGSNRTLFYVASYTQPEPDFLPKLSAFLSKWGIVVRESVVFENQSNLLTAFPSMYESKVLLSDSDLHPSLGERPTLPIIYYAKPMKLHKPQGNRIVTPLWLTSEFSGEFPQDKVGNWQVTDHDYSGPIPVLALSQEKRQDETTANVIALTSYLSLDENSNSSVKSSSFDYLLGLFHKLTQEKNHIYISPKVFPQQEFFIVSTQQQVLGTIVAIILPALVILLGIIVLVRRK